MDATALLQPTRLAVDAGTRGVDGGVTATGVLVRRRGPKRGSVIRSNTVTMHHYAGWICALRKKVLGEAGSSAPDHPFFVRKMRCEGTLLV